MRVRAIILPLLLVLFGLAGPATADDAARKLIVTGTGTAAGEPDLITIDVGVMSVAGTAEEALAQNSSATAKVIGTIKAAGIRDKQIQTQRFDVIPVFENREMRDRSEPQEPRIVGYRVQHMLNVRAADTSKLAMVLDKAVKSGANGIGQIRFSLEDPSALTDEALDAAVADARRKAERIAKAAGAKLGPILSIREGGGGVVDGPMPVMAEMARSAAPPIQSGETSVSATVTVVWQIAD